MHKGWMVLVAGLMLAPVGRAGVSHVVNDFDGDGRTDLGTFNNRGGTWVLRLSGNGAWPSNAVQTFTLGSFNSIPVPGDFDGDGRADLCVYEPTSSRWYLQTSTAPATNFVFGYHGGLPIAGDFDDDGRDDVGICEPARGAWSVRLSSGGVSNFTLGSAGCVPVVDDFDGDGRADAGVYLSSNGTWQLRRSTAGLQTRNHGYPRTYPVTGDFDGDGQADLGVMDVELKGYISGANHLYLLQTTAGSTGGYFTTTGSSRSGEHVRGDYDGDGRMDLFRPDFSSYFLNGSYRNPNDASFIPLPSTTNTSYGTDLNGSIPVLDLLQGWRPLDASGFPSFSPVSGVASLANGKQLKISFGDGFSSVVKVKDSAGNTATAHVGLLGDLPHQHLSCPGLPGTGPITMMVSAAGAFNIPLYVDAGFNGLYLTIIKSTGTYRDSQGAQAVTLYRSQLALYLFGAL